jgi:hypothetical protein
MSAFLGVKTMTESSELRSGFSRILRSHNIDNLALEMELCEFVKPSHPTRSKENTRKEIIEALLNSGKVADTRELISTTIAEELLNPGGKDGAEFIEFAYLRSKHGEDISVFSQWWLTNNPDPKYWSFKRMREMWPIAFRKKKQRYVTPEKWEGEFISAKEAK